MAIRKVITEGNDILYKKCKPVEKFDDKLSILIDDMLDTMRKERGVGLAAPQVGILRRVIVIEIGEKKIEVVNPEIIEAGGEQRAEEGCLSCPGFVGTTLRPMYVKVIGKDRKGNEVSYFGRNLKARAFCHEIDHLDGILFKSRLIWLTLGYNFNV